MHYSTSSCSFSCPNYFPMMSSNLINGYRPHLRQHCSNSLLILTRHFDEIICYLESWNGYLALPIKQKIFGDQIQSKESINGLSGHIFVQKIAWLAYSLHGPSSSSPALCRHTPWVTQAGCSHTIQRRVEFSCMMLWSNPNQQPGLILAHSPISGIREKIKRAKARESVGWGWEKV